MSVSGNASHQANSDHEGTQAKNDAHTDLLLDFELGFVEEEDGYRDDY